MRLKQTCPFLLFFFCSEKAGAKSRRQQKKKKKKEVTADAVMQSRRGSCWECHTAFGHTSRAWPWGSLSPFLLRRIRGVSGEHSSWSCVFLIFFLFCLPACCTLVHTWGEKMQTEVVNSSRKTWIGGRERTRKECGSWSPQMGSDPVASPSD